MIDHKTGDIIESYPEHPVYLRTYQPVTDAANQQQQRRQQFFSGKEEEDARSLDDSTATSILEANTIASSDMSSTSRDQPRLMPQQQQQQRPTHGGRPAAAASVQAGVIPPPHSGKVYFAPPDVGPSSASAQNPLVPRPTPIGHNNNHHQQHHQHHHHHPHHPQSQHPSEAFKQALNRLHQMPSHERHDIAIVTEPDDYDFDDVVDANEVAAMAYMAAAANQQQSRNFPEIKIAADNVTAAGHSMPLMAVQPSRHHASGGRGVTVATGNAAAAAPSSPSSSQRNDKRAILYTPKPQTPLSSKQQIVLQRGPSIRNKPTSSSPQNYNHTNATTTSLSPTTITHNTSKLGQNRRKLLHTQSSSIVDTLDTPIEQFDLYNFCYNIRVLLILLLSSACIYLLVSPPLHLDCSKYRPTYTYVSLICSSVNLIWVVIFTLFWYCNGITRTLYANISSSAFIVTIYTILVGLNLALAIVFFLVNTCYSQKLHETKSVLADHVYALPSNLDSSYYARNTLTNNELDSLDLPISYARIKEITDSVEHLEFLDSPEGPVGYLSKQRLFRRQDGDFDSPNAANLPNVIDDLVETTTTAMSATTTTLTSTTEDEDLLYDGEQTTMMMPQMSPIEAFWEYIKQAINGMKQKFRRFLTTYDLKFLGALHALCAICFQYLAMKVAVVRSYYCLDSSAYA